jgi:DNA-binding HxlR family transcriptional regulator
VRKDHRSECLINRTVELFGDQWSLLILRDIILMDRRHFRELLTNSLEGIASNILADRLQRLVEQGILVRSQDASHKQKAIYSLTERGIDLFPLLMEMVTWGHKYLPASKLMGLAKVLDQGGAELQAEFVTELRRTHLPKSSAKKTTARKKSRRPTKSTRVVATQKLRLAYDAALAKRQQ